MMASVCMECTMHKSSTIFAVSGKSELIHAPHSPCCANENNDAVTGNDFCPLVIPVRR